MWGGGGGMLSFSVHAEPNKANYPDDTIKVTL